MSAREEILARVRAALAEADTAPVQVPREYRTSLSGEVPSGEGLLDLFAERVEDYRATLVRCSPDAVTDTVRSALADSQRVVVPDGFGYDVPGGISDTGLTAAELDEVDAVVTEAAVGIAVTGTIVLTHGTGQGRRALSLVPDLHVCVIRADQVVPGLPDAVRLLDPSSPQTWISGPSATSDIELDRVEGVHGPRTLHVVLVT